MEKYVTIEEQYTACHALASRQREVVLYGGVDAALLDIDLMEGYDFEYWCAFALSVLGYSDVRVTTGSGDQGVDIVAVKDSLRYAIQCKRYSSNLGNTPVQEVHAGKYLYHCHVGVVITNQFFSYGARELAESTGILLWDRDWIKAFLSSEGYGRYIQGSSGKAAEHRAPHEAPKVKEALFEDELFPMAVDIVLKTNQASVSVLQRHLKLGYARAARIMDEMEEKGIVGPFVGSKPRSIIVSKEQWCMMQGDPAPGFEKTLVEENTPRYAPPDQGNNTLNQINLEDVSLPKDQSSHDDRVKPNLAKNVMQNIHCVIEKMISRIHI